MTDQNKAIDAIDQRILEALLDNARISQRELGQRVGLTPPSVAERLRRLEERDIVRSYTVDINPQALGYDLQAIVRIRPLPGKLKAVQKLIQETPEFVECDKVTGDDCFVARLLLRSMSQLDEILDRIIDYAETNTAVVKSHPVPRRLPPLRPG